MTAIPALVVQFLLIHGFRRAAVGILPWLFALIDRAGLRIGIGMPLL